MEVNTKHVLAVFSLMVGLSFGVPYIVTEQENSSWLMLAIIFLGIALFFWIWIMREQQSAEEAATDALDAAEENLKKLEAQAAEAEKEDVTPTAEKDIPIARTPPATSAVGQTEAEVVEEALEDSPQTETVVEVEPEPEPVLETVDVSDDEAVEEVPAEEPEPVAEKVDVPVEVEQEDAPETVEEKSAPEPVAEASDEPDDLTRVEGIGPKYAQLLGEAGITTFAQVAKMDEDTIVATIKAQGGRKSASMGTWAEQAKLAAAGDWEALEALQDELDGGRR